jgi:aldehyde dehydrogenase (NAD+)
MKPTTANVDAPAPALAPVSSRIAWCEGFERLLVERERDLVAAVRADIGKAEWETVTQEFLPLVASIRWHRANAERLLAPARVGGGPWWLLGQRHWRLRVPVGRVLVIATWNYPLQLVGIQLTQAVVAGNRVVVKPSERSPRSQRMLLDLARAAASAAGLPPDTVTSAEATREAGRELLERERFDHVVFTGSTAVGREVALACARTLTPSTLELSGRDSAIVLADADPKLAARSIWHAATMNAGQTCMAPRRALVDRAIYQRFLDALRPLAASARPVRLSDHSMADRCVQLAEAAVRAGGRSLGGVIEPSNAGSMRPLCVESCPRDAGLFEGDHFGPVLAVVPVDGPADALAAHRAVGQHLATSVFTGAPSAALADAAFIAALGSGVVTINDAVIPTGHPGIAIEGRGPSGWGASRGEAGLLALTREVACSATARRLRAPLDEPDARGKRWLRRLGFGGRDAAGTPSAAPDTHELPAATRR